MHLKGTKNKAGGDDPDSSVADGYALTFGVSKDFMDKFFEQSSDWHPVKNGMIRYASNRADMKAMTKENANHKHWPRAVQSEGRPARPRRDVVRSITDWELA